MTINFQCNENTVHFWSSVISFCILQIRREKAYSVYMSEPLKNGVNTLPVCLLCVDCLSRIIDITEKNSDLAIRNEHQKCI